MYQLTGEYECKLDAKGRLKMPSALISQVKGNTVFTINRGFEKHLMLYPQEVWGRKTNEINQLNIYNTKHRQAMRYFYRGATELSLDSSGRLLVPKGLMDYALLGKEVVLFAYHEQIELWSKERYEEMLNMEPSDFSEIADGLFGSEENRVGVDE